jgi:2-polyprenyl-6-methoxyphenol hydroxylase-like FAD-dependent oxidoreductase
MEHPLPPRDSEDRYVPAVADQPLKVLISGAGIAGSTLACLLARSGHLVTVVERDQGVRSSGNPVDIRGGAFDLVERLSLVPRLHEVATRVRRVVFVDTHGQPLASMATRRSQDRELEVPRADLSAALVDAARNEAEFRFDDTIVGIVDDGRGVDAAFELAAPQRFDLVVGADGLHSRVRRLTFGPESDFVTSLGMYVATVHLQIQMERADSVLMFNEPAAATAVHPGAGKPGAAFMFRSSATVSPRDRDAVERILTSVYGHAGWRAPEFLAAYLRAPDTYFDTVSRVRLPDWSKGLVTLLGDAASCISLFGEGSSSAILGARTLARALDASSRDVPAALARYEATHRPVNMRGQRAAPIAAHLLVPKSQAGISFRNFALRLSSRRGHRPAESSAA